MAFQSTLFSMNWRISQWPNRCSEDNDSEEEKTGKYEFALKIVRSVYQTHSLNKIIDYITKSNRTSVALYYFSRTNNFVGTAFFIFHP